MEKRHILCSKTYFSKSCAVYNVEKYCRRGHVTDDNITRRMRMTCWIPKATHTHTLRICNATCFSTATMFARMHLSVLCHTYIACLVKPSSSFAPWLAWNLRSLVILEGPCWTVWGSNPAMGKKLNSFSEISGPVRGPTQHPLTLVLGVSSRG